MVFADRRLCRLCFFFFNDTATTEIYTLSLHDALPILTQKLTVPAVGGVVHDVVALYLTESAKYASSAVSRLQRTHLNPRYHALSFVFSCFGKAIRGGIAIINTTTSSLMSVKTMRFSLT